MVLKLIELWQVALESLQKLRLYYNQSIINNQKKKSLELLQILKKMGGIGTLLIIMPTKKYMTIKEKKSILGHLVLVMKVFGKKIVMRNNLVKSSYFILITFVVGSIIAWLLIIGLCWSFYYLQGPHYEFNDMLKIFKWMYQATDLFSTFILLFSLVMTIFFYWKKKKTMYKGFLFSFVYSLLILLFYFIIRDV